MGRIEEKIIKPPMERITSGKIFRPSRNFLYKEWTKMGATAFAIWLCIMLGFLGITYLISLSDSSEIPDYGSFLATWFSPVNSWLIVVNLLWLIPAAVIAPIYIRNIEYSVKSEKGESMPEVYVKKGIFTITRKHVPFRTITNISSNAGIFDRLYGIGSVHIETAGFSGTSQTGPEEKLEGIVFYEELRDYILNELRRFKAPYVIGTEVVYPEDEPVPRGPGLDDEMLITLREIRDLLRKKSE